MSKLELSQESSTLPPPQPQIDPELRFTPVDEIGMPLPLVPISRENGKVSQLNPDWHHHFHPKKSPILVRDLGGQAVRSVRLQRTDYDQHHNDYHGYYFGPPLPETKQRQFGIVVLASAGYVPDRAISFKDGQPEEVHLTNRQRRLLWAKGDLRIASTEKVRKFMIDYTLSQDLTDINEKLVDEFLNTPNHQRRYHIGGMLLQFAIERATEPIDPFYRTAWKSGLMPRESSSRAQRLIKNRLRIKQNRPRLIDQLEQTLAA
ncbi:MAG: hypothetical protein M3Q36_03040 [bacterium]|nr:hypothetical protein [bacterium]